MAIDIFDIQPSVISRDLKGKYVLLYGKPKSGKTTAASQFPKALLCAFEMGYNAIGGIRAANITKWAEFKQIIRQLDDDRAREMYETIVIDTVTIAWDLCEQYVCAQNGVQKIADVAWGAGYSACKKEFETQLRRITQLGYGVVLIAHSASHFEKTADGADVEIISPDLPKRSAEVCNGIVDIIGYIGNEFVNGEVKRWLYTRETPTLFAGSRFKYLKSKIPFSYQDLVNAIAEAIQLAEDKDGAVVVNNAPIIPTEEKLDFNAVRAEALKLWTTLVGTGETEAQQEMAKTISKKIEITMGHRMKLSEFSEDQVDLLNLVVIDMKDLLK